MTRLGVIGYPASHSLSPLIHSYWFERHGIEGVYEIVESSDFSSDAHNCCVSGWRGLNVTLPYKEDAYHWVDENDEAAQAMGAVNCVVFDNGKRTGYNTDAFGFGASLDEEAAWWRERHQETVVVLGAGGVARAIVYALREAGFSRLRIVNRTQTRAASLGAFWNEGDKARSWSFYSYADVNEALKNAFLVVNATSLGMTGAQSLPVSLAKASLAAHAIVFDSVYTPRQTPLLREAQSLGYHGVGGLGMLIHQARLSFAHWFDVMPANDENLRQLLGATKI